MNTFFETIFEQAKSQFQESIEPETRVEDSLFTTLKRKHTIYRMPHYGGRAYFTMHGDEPRLMTGITAVTKKIQNIREENQFLNEWRVNMAASGQDSERYAWMASEFGTLVHIVAGHLFSARSRGEAFSTNGLDRMLSDYMRNINIDGYYYKDWYISLTRAIKSLNEFYNKANPEVLAVEYTVADFENNICTPLDLVLYMDTEELVDVPNKKKREKRIVRNLWNLNIKARKKPERNVHDKYQTCAEQYIFNGYSDMKIERTGILSPSWTWKTKPDCNVHEFTGEFTQAEWEQYLKIIRWVFPKLFNPDLTQLISESNIFSITEHGEVKESEKITIADYIKRRFE